MSHGNKHEVEPMLKEISQIGRGAKDFLQKTAL
jgi:hypothetical protein